ncbi:MAG: MFS transporter [bacterium]|nr:MFS transporter [bacterium]
MNPLARKIQNTHLLLTFGNTFAASLIWGINTLFLLDAGLSNFQAFAANAFFTIGMVLFEIPTGIVADTWGRRTSYLLGTLTLASTTFLYYLLWQTHAPFWQWAAVSSLLGLGFTFFSGATEAWLVDALDFAKFNGSLESVFGKAQIATGVAMLSGSVSGGIIAEYTSLGMPFIIRGVILSLLFIVAFVLMKDLGFTPEKNVKPIKMIKRTLNESLKHGLKNPPVKWLMISALFSSSVGFYVFYALQPYLVGLYGDTEAYTIAGLAAALVAGAQIVGGILAPKIRKLFRLRTSAIIMATLASCAVLVTLGLISNFYIALIFVAAWGLLFAAIMPIRQAYLNGMIPSKQRATVLSFDSLMGNSSGIVVQPGLGKSADVYSYGTSFIIGSVIQLLALPFIYLSRTQHHVADKRDSE